MLSSTDEDCTLLSRKIPSLFMFDAKQRDGSSSTGFSSFSNFKNIYITGHSNGAINFFDASSPLLIPIVSFNQQTGKQVGYMFSVLLTSHLQTCYRL
nr:transducin/WD40 repeat-like superfamily protein [Tanacetum cinerariifolium]